MGDELPEVITADMLRARRNVNVDMDDFEIPAELLAGLDEKIGEDEDEEDVPAKKGKSKVKAKPKSRLGPKRRPNPRSAAMPSGMTGFF